MEVFLDKWKSPIELEEAIAYWAVWIYDFVLVGTRNLLTAVHFHGGQFIQRFHKIL